MINKPVIVFIFPNCMGGVASFNRNLINYTSLKDHCSIRVILLEPKEDKRARFTDEIKADEIIHFSYSVLDKQYNTCERLHKFVGEESGCIVTDNNVVLKMAGLFNTNKRIIYLVHDYYYVHDALQFEPVIDMAVAHSSFFCDILLAANADYHGKVKHITYGVELPPIGLTKPSNEILKLIFLGRLVEEKGVLLLKEIDELLSQKEVSVEWTIVGKGPLLETLLKSWKENNNVHFVQATDTAAVYTILEQQDILVFPSWGEGTPVSIMEAISRGVVPVVSDLPGGTRDMVTEEIGMRCSVKDAESYVMAISYLHHNRGELKLRQEACLRLGAVQYDINVAADKFLFFFSRASSKDIDTQKIEKRCSLFKIRQVDITWLGSI